MKGKKYLFLISIELSRSCLSQ